MTKQEAIEILEEVKEVDDTMYAYNPAYMNALDMAIEALKEIQLYKDNKLCLVPTDVYSRQCSELDAYKEIGTVEECREAVEKQSTKKTHIVTNEFLGGTSYVCPNCGTEMMLIDRNRIQWGRMQKYCSCCGQAIDENLEGMEDE